MLTLCQIRFQIAKKNRISFTFYLMLTIFLIFYSLPSTIINAIHVRSKYYTALSNIKDNKNKNSLNHKKYELFTDFISNELNNSAIIANKIKNGKKLSEFIKKETNIKLNYYLEKNELNIGNNENLIIYTEKEGKNNFELRIKEKQKKTLNFFNSNISDFKSIINYIYSFFSHKKNSNSDTITNFQSLIIKYLASENNLDFHNITINSEFKLFNSLGDENYKDDTIDDIFIGLAFSFGMTLLIYYLIEQVEDESEQKLKDFLEMQGLSKSKHILSWVFTFCLFSIAPLIAFLCFGGYYFVYRYHFFLINIFLYMLSSYSFMSFFLTIIPTIKNGSNVVKVFNFITMILGACLSIPKMKRKIKLIFCIFPNVNIYYTIGVLYTITNKRYRRKTNSKTWIKNVSFIDSLLFFVGEIVFYNLITIIAYFYKRSGFNFCLFFRSLCCRNINNERNEPLIQGNKDNINNNLLNYEIHHQDLTLIEQQNKNENNCLQIIGLTKKYDDLKAVNNFNGEFFPNEIFCLLGHKGAGKTTLINIISGLIKPEEGDILFNGVSLIKNRDLAFKNIGLCQQENKFFEFLTVNRNLELIYDIKGIQRNRDEIRNLILNLGLSDVQNKLCKDLSEDQKRKVCIALALINGKKIILLDEPTNGMDIKAKKKLYELLINYKREKIILVTTHSLEEAQKLGTRIGIMSDGHFICSGTTTYLKTMYPCEININLIINSKIFNEMNRNSFFEKIKEYEPKLEIKISSKSLFSLYIKENNEHITEIFNYIEKIKELYGIEDYTVGSGSLEDIFLEINKKSNINDIKYITKNDENINIMENRFKTAGFCSQLYTQLCRNLLYIKRNIISLILQYLGAIFCGYLFLIVLSNLFFHKDDENYYYLSNKNSYFNNNKLEKFYNINISIKNNSINIFSGIINKKKVIEGKIFANLDTKSFFKKKVINDDETIIIIGIILGYYIFLSGIIFEKIIEGKAKYFLYLNGCNMCSYWVSFFIIDFIKLLIFTALLLLPLLIITRIGFYLFLCFPMANLSSLVFIYLFCSFCKNKVHGYLFIILSITLPILIIFILRLLFLFYNEQMFSRFYFTYYDISPITSLTISLLRVIESNVIYELDHVNHSRFYKPVIYVILEQIAQLVNFGIYFTLFLLNEKGYLSKKYMNSRPKDLNYVFSEETPAEEFFACNNLRNPIVSQNINQNTSNNNINNNNNNINNNNLMNNQNNSLINSNNNIQNNIINENINNNNFNNINNFGNQNDNIIDINTNNNQNNMNINNINSNTIEGYNQMMSLQRNNNINNNSNQNIQNNNIQNDGENNEVNLNPFIIKEIQKLGSQMDLTIKIEELYKTYFSHRKNVRVLNNLNLGLEPNEKFGILGFNGSGKTTIFKAIINEILYEKGQITLFGNDNKTQFKQIRSMIGYCPQENPLFDYMKVREIISFYIKLTESTETIESICSRFDLYKYLNTYCINLSEGNKRKLTLSIALMNNPSLLLLDEPTTGVDPESKRIIWKNLYELSNTGYQYNMILATHSIEEAEILCDRISWLHKRNFVCIGNPEQLKLKYSNGYKMNIKFVDTVLNKKDASALTDKMVEDDFSEICNLIRGFNNYSKYILGNPSIILLIRALIEVIKEIKPNTKDLKLLNIEKDFSFTIQIHILKEKQSILFSQIFNLKNKNPKISEISINLKYLGDILTSFQ